LLLLLLLRLGHIVEEGGKPLELAVCHGSRAGWKGWWGGGREWEGVDVVGVAWGKAGLRADKGSRMPRPFSLFHWVAECILQPRKKGRKRSSPCCLLPPASSACQED